MSMTATNTADEMRRAVAEGFAFKTLLVDAIVGVGFPTLLLASVCEDAGLAVFVGNQHNPAWEWKRNALARNPTEKLQGLYEALCDARDEAHSEQTRDNDGVGPTVAMILNAGGHHAS